MSAVLYGLALGVSALAVAVVLVGVGYLIGRESMRRQAVRKVDELVSAFDQMQSPLAFDRALAVRASLKGDC